MWVIFQWITRGGWKDRQIHREGNQSSTMCLCTSYQGLSVPFWATLGIVKGPLGWEDISVSTVWSLSFSFSTYQDERLASKVCFSIKNLCSCVLLNSDASENLWQDFSRSVPVLLPICQIQLWVPILVNTISPEKVPVGKLWNGMCHLGLDLEI
jgi:hypothetical protein